MNTLKGTPTDHLTQNKVARITGGCYGVAVMVWFLQALLLPAYHAISSPGLAVSFIAEVGLALWLLVRGVRAAAPSSRSSGAAA